MPLFHNKKEERRQQDLAAAQAGIPGSTMVPAPGMAAPGQVAAASNVSGRTPGLPGPAPHTAGPHKQNKLDPTVDSRSGGMQLLAPGVQSAPLATGVPGQTAAQIPGQGMTVPMGSNNPYGAQNQPHLQSIFDPRGGSTQGNTGYYTTAGPTGAAPMGNAAVPRNIPEGTYDPRSSFPANTVDPRIDWDAEYSARMTGAMPTTQAQSIYPPGVGGPAPNTVGPHRRDWMNKLDPGVDSRPRDFNSAAYDSTGRRMV